VIDPQSLVVVPARDLKKDEAHDGWEAFNFPSVKIMIGDAHKCYESIAPPPAPSNSTI
jgi:hypothetical protein